MYQTHSDLINATQLYQAACSESLDSDSTLGLPYRSKNPDQCGTSPIQINVHQTHSELISITQQHKITYSVSLYDTWAVYTEAQILINVLLPQTWIKVTQPYQVACSESLELNITLELSMLEYRSS